MSLIKDLPVYNLTPKMYPLKKLTWRRGPKVEQARVEFTIAPLLAYILDPSIQELLQRHF